MKVTTKGHYAVRAILDLVKYGNGGPVRLKDVSTRQNLPLHYLEQLFRKLRANGVVTSIRGPGGGYILSNAPEQTSVGAILTSVGEELNPGNFAIPENGEASEELSITQGFFNSLGDAILTRLSNTSLKDLSDETGGEPKAV